MSCMPIVLFGIHFSCLFVVVIYTLGLPTTTQYLIIVYIMPRDILAYLGIISSLFVGMSGYYREKQ